MDRRSAIAAIGALAASPMAPSIAQEDWPQGPIRLVVPFAPGASSDSLARLITGKVSGPLGGRFVVENRAGAGGLLAAQRVARAAPDGYTLLWGGGTAITNAVMQPNPGYDVMKDFTPIITIVENPAVLAVKADRPWRSIQDLFVAAREARDGPMRYGSGGIGTPAHMAGAAMLKLIGAEGIHVPYRGANQATFAVEQGEVDFAFAISNIALPRHQQQAVRILLSAGSQRLAALADVPTMAELLPRGPVITSMSSVAGPGGLPPAIATKIHAAFSDTIRRDAALRESLEREGGSIVLSPSPAAYAAAWGAELQRLRELVALSGVRAE